MSKLLALISSSLIVLFLYGTVNQTCTVLHFYANQKEIAEKFCENKDKPEMNCHGKCHLNKELKVQTNEASNKQLPQEIRPYIIWLLAYSSSSLTLENIRSNRDQFFHLEKDVQTYSCSLLKPPQLV